MSIPLLEYKPASQNQRVSGYEVPSEDTPRVYRLEGSSSDRDFEDLIWAAYRQVFSEHETLKRYRQGTLETQLKNRSITVRDFIRGLAKSEVFRRLVLEPNSNYRVVELSLKRLLGRAPYNKQEEIAWSIKIATLGFDGFVDALLDSEEYQSSFGENIVPYQRRRYKDRPFNLVTPRYNDYWRDKPENQPYQWGNIQHFLEMARSINPRPAQPMRVKTDQIKIPDMTQNQTENIPVSINPTASFPLG